MRCDVDRKSTDQITDPKIKCETFVNKLPIPTIPPEKKKTDL